MVGSGDGGPSRGRACAVLIAAAVASWCLSPRDAAAGGGRAILSLGDDSYVAWSEVEARTGATVTRELGTAPLDDFSLLVVSNVGYTSLPEAVRDGLPDYLARGGSVLVTGGSRAYGSGGYAGTEFGELLPLRPSREDFGYHPYGPTYIVQPEHPILKGIVIPTMAYFNELEVNDHSIEIAYYHKAVARGPTVGGTAPPGVTGGARVARPLTVGVALPAMPLIAERRVGAGTILAIAIDLALPLDKDAWSDRGRFAQNCIDYLLQRSRIVPALRSPGSAGGR